MALSHFASPSEPFNFTRDTIDRLATERPNGLALMWVAAGGAQETRSFSELSRASVRAAAVLLKAGVCRGDTVLILMSREIEWWEVMLGCIRIGAVAAPCTTQLTTKDIAFRLEASASKFLVAAHHIAEQADVAIEGRQVMRIIVGGQRDGWLGFEGAVADHAGHMADTCASDPMLCYFTSGTTGQPKMTIHGHDYARAHNITGSYWLDLGPGDLHWNMSDTGWAKAAWSSLFAPWQQGAAIFVYHAEGFDPVTTADLLERYPITTLCAPPTAYRMLVQDNLSTRSFARLRHCVSAGEPLNSDAIEQWRAQTGLEIYDGYGQTETVLICANRPGYSRQGSMGLPPAEFDLAVVDEHGNRLPPGQEGNIALSVNGPRPPGLFLEYLNAPEYTASTFRNGWYFTGDRGMNDEEGFFWFVGRADDVILSSGYRIGPFEVESALQTHPAVVESAVISSPHPTRGEVVKALIVLVPDQTPDERLKRDIQEHVRATTAPYKYPRLVEFVDALPKTISGKIKRKLLRDKEWARSDTAAT